MNIQIPPVTQALILVNVVVFFVEMLLEQMFGLGLRGWFGLWPIGVEVPQNVGPGFMPWQVVTYAFLHGDMWHLFFNMFALFMFGSEIERLYGSRWYLLYFTVCVLSAAAAQLIVAAVTNAPAYPTIGASGGVFGLLLAFGMNFPRRTIVLVIPPIPMPAWLFVTLYGVLELYFGVFGVMPGVAHFAHLGGMVGGFLMLKQRRGWRR
ncbi:MAG: rhomboid family intramembrane serine protease [Gammaproteobacteria bacterium]|nr:rhomboid family intramembrane serine protease [Gammaproteobacteria bacterium]